MVSCYTIPLESILCPLYIYDIFHYDAKFIIKANDLYRNTAFLLLSPCYSLTPLFLLCYNSSPKSPSFTVSPHLSKQVIILTIVCLSWLTNVYPQLSLSQEPIYRAAIDQAEEKYSKIITPQHQSSNIPKPHFVSTNLKRTILFTQANCGCPRNKTILTPE